jgi:hypothetical protein
MKKNGVVHGILDFCGEKKVTFKIMKSYFDKDSFFSSDFPFHNFGDSHSGKK